MTTTQEIRRSFLERQENTVNNHLLVVSQKRYSTLNHSVCSSKNVCQDSKNPPLLFQNVRWCFSSSLRKNSFEKHKLSGSIQIKNNSQKKTGPQPVTLTRYEEHAPCSWEVERSVGRHICKKPAICGLPVVTDLMSEFYSKCNVHQQDWAIYEKRLKR